MPKPRFVVFSSGKLIEVIEGIRENLRRDVEVTLWTEGFFDNNEAPITNFLKKLITYDAAILVLGADDLIESTSSDKRYVPRDNVIFELGACMQRLGLKKTYMIRPEQKAIKLPSYLSGLDLLTYEIRSDKNFVAGTGSACAQIIRLFFELDKIAFYSDLPAVGLAYGYFFNFLKPLYRRLNFRGATFGDFTFEKGNFEIEILIPERIIERKNIGPVYERLNLQKNDVDLDNGRNISFHNRKIEAINNTLVICDVPTTLTTSKQIIKMVDEFWGKGDKKYKEDLEKKELLNFQRSLNNIIETDDYVSTMKVTVKDLDQS